MRPIVKPCNDLFIIAMLYDIQCAVTFIVSNNATETVRNIKLF